MIRKEGGRFVVKSESGDRKLGSYRTKSEAVRRLRQVEYFKKRGHERSGK